MTRFAMLLAAALAAAGCDDDCDELQEEAEALVAAAQACGGGDGCVLVDMYEVAGLDNCLGPFQCTRALNASTDLDAFRREARRIAASYDGCSPCVVADCLDPSIARCDEAAGLCRAEEGSADQARPRGSPVVRAVAAGPRASSPLPCASRAAALHASRPPAFVHRARSPSRVEPEAPHASSPLPCA